MANMSELERCPVCGRRAALVDKIPFTPLYRVICAGCYTETADLYLTEESAVAAWNMRKEQP